MDTTRKQAAWLICAVMVAVAGGCAGCPMRQTFPTNIDAGVDPRTSAVLSIGCPDAGTSCDVDPTEMSGGDCTTGGCKPGSLNGQGIYNAETSNYCFLYQGQPMFCPEAFINTPDGAVRLEIRRLDDPLVIRREKVRATFQEDGSPPVSVDVHEISSDRSQFAIKYAFTANPAEEHVATGEELKKLTLLVGPYPSPLNTPVRYDVKVTPLASTKTATDGLQRYQVQYRETTSSPDWLNHCEETTPRQQQGSSNDDLAVAFLGQRRIDGVTAFVTPNATATTMGCEKGAIVSCMSWGYTPWSTKPGTQERSDYVFGSCLQAKRAAYFVQSNDFNSYTVNGTLIQLRDQYGIQQTDPKTLHLEAIWSPRGAVCLNIQNVRRDELRKTISGLNRPQPGGKEGYNVPPCSNPPEWSLKGKLATGPHAAPMAGDPQ